VGRVCRARCSGVPPIGQTFLLADTVWSAVHIYLGKHLSHQLGSALNFDPTVQLFVAGLGVSLFAVAGRAFSRRNL
jgi:hypothetical protein